MNQRDQVMLEYITWITENSDYVYNDEELPKILFKTQRRMAELFYGEDFREDIPGNISGLYNTIENEIILPYGTKFSDYNNQPTLVHELVHFLQNTHGKFGNVCVGELEIEAYELQIQWMDEVGHTQERPDEFSYRVLILACYPYL